MDDFVWGRRVGATSVALGALNHRHAAYQSPRATSVAPTVCRAASAKGTAINPALPLPFDKFINGRVNSSDPGGGITVTTRSTMKPPGRSSPAAGAAWHRA